MKSSNLEIENLISEIVALKLKICHRISCSKTGSMQLQGQVKEQTSCVDSMLAVQTKWLCSYKVKLKENESYVC
jgi:hypothetical protein